MAIAQRHCPLPFFTSHAMSHFCVGSFVILMALVHSPQPTLLTRPLLHLAPIRFGMAACATLRYSLKAARGRNTDRFAVAWGSPSHRHHKTRPLMRWTGSGTRSGTANHWWLRLSRRKHNSGPLKKSATHTPPTTRRAGNGLVNPSLDRSSPLAFYGEIRPVS